MHSEEKTLRPLNDQLNSSKRSAVGMSYLVLGIVLALGFGGTLLFYSLDLNLMWPIGLTVVTLAASLIASIGDPERVALWVRSWSLPTIFDPRKRMH